MKGYRTIIFNALMLLLATLSWSGVEVPDAEAVNAFLDHLDAVVLFAAPIGNAVLRVITDTPVGQKV